MDSAVDVNVGHSDLQDELLQRADRTGTPHCKRESATLHPCMCSHASPTVLLAAGGAWWRRDAGHTPSEQDPCDRRTMFREPHGLAEISSELPRVLRLFLPICSFSVSLHTVGDTHGDLKAALTLPSTVTLHSRFLQQTSCWASS